MRQMASLAPAKTSRPPRTLKTKMHGNGNRMTRRSSLRQPRSRRDLRDHTRCRRAHVNAPVHRPSQYSQKTQAHLLLTVHRSTPQLSYGAVSSTGPPYHAALVGAPPSLPNTMSAPVVTMTFSPSAQIGASSATTRPLVIRPRRNATPLFLHRTPIFPPRGSPPISQLGQPRSSVSTSPLGFGHPRSASTPQLAPARPSPSTCNRASAPPTGSGLRSASDSAMGRTRMPSSEAPHLPKRCATMDVDGSSPLAPLFSRPSTPTDKRGPAPLHDGSHLSRISPFPSPPSSVSSSPSPLPPSFLSLVHVEKDLPPVPPPTEPATPSEDDVLDPEDTESCFPLLERPSRIPNIRPLSYDAEATIRELEELAASIMLQGPVREVEQLAASLKVFGIPHIETDMWRENEMPAAMAEESSPITPRPSQFQQKHTHARPVDVVQSQARLAVPHIVVTNPSTENLLEQLNRSGSSLKDGDETEELLWMEDYGAWGTSEKGKWKAVPGEAEDEEAGGHEQPPKAGIFPPTRPSLEKAYIYEPVGAPEFLIGSSTSPVARAASGYRSRRPSRRSVPDTGRVQRRSRRPGPLVLANPAQADWDLEAQLAASLFLRTPKPRRPQTSPSTPQNRHQIAPSAWPSLKKSQSANGPVTAPTSRPTDPTTNPVPTDGHRRPGSIPTMPLTPAPAPPSGSPSASRGANARRRAQGDGDKTLQAVSWPSFPFPFPVGSESESRGGTSSEPSTPRPSPRPRLKSLKSLFKHWSK
ncbi:hypothetical protein LXA43DRAFT_573524 [Ganoderma leucocontextum]|nr:hypothetical protein LXA43DRAFT_573524 [Ganoderma leucocontextum]